MDQSSNDKHAHAAPGSVTTGPISGSRKVYASPRSHPDIRVPFREIALSDPIPNYPMTMQGYLAPELKDGIRKAFLELKDPVILKLFRVEKLAPASDKDYDVLRDMGTTLNLDLAKL